MRALVQRVNFAQVSIGVENAGQIDRGLFVLLGVGKEDTEKKAKELAKQIAFLRIMADENQKMNLSILDTTKQVLVVSQFTLYADTSKGNRPSFVKAESPQKAAYLYDFFVKSLHEEGLKVATGRFGKYMNIKLELDGPVTITLDK